MVEGPSVEDYKREGLQRIHALIVGGGATGQIYGHFLAESGVEVAYYLKPRYAAEAEEGFDLHPYGLIGRRPHRHFGGFTVYTRPQEVRGAHIDQIWLCISAPAMRSGIVQMLADSCPDALWVCTQPGLDAREYMLESVPADRLVMGMTGYIAYQAPLPGEELFPAGCAYYLPPLSPSLFAGRYAETVANLLQRGGLPAGARPDVETIARYSSGILIPFVLSLETVGWSLAALKKDDQTLKRMCGAITEISASIERETGARQGVRSNFQQKWLWKLLLSVANTMTPFDLETYLDYHFTKVRRQSEDMIHEFKLLCDRQGFESTNLEKLEDAWYERRPSVHESAQLATLGVRSEVDTAPQPVFRDGDDDVTPSPASVAGALPIPTEDTQPVPILMPESEEPTDETNPAETLKSEPEAPRVAAAQSGDETMRMPADGLEQTSEADTREHERLASSDDAATKEKVRRAVLADVDGSDDFSELLREAAETQSGLDTRPDREKLADTNPTTGTANLATIPARPAKHRLPLPSLGRKGTSTDEPTQPVPVMKDPELAVDTTDPAPTKPMKRLDDEPVKGEVDFGKKDAGLGKQDFIQTEFGGGGAFDPTNLGSSFGTDDD